MTTTGIRALSDYVMTAKYANKVAEARRRETKDEARKRVFDMHREYYGHIPGAEKYIAEAERAFSEELALGSQRVLQFGGERMLKKHARGYNCVSSFADRARFFQECFWLLLCGCGTGFSVQWHHVAKLPAIKMPDNTRLKTFRVPDTIEGWADALGVLMSSYFDSDDTPFPEYRGAVVDFIFDDIRPEGAPLAGGGKAPGPEPLKRSLEKIRHLLQATTAMHMIPVDSNAVGFRTTKAREFHQLHRLQPIDVYDIIMHASDAVLSGGVRRSATICVFSADDEDMARAKTGDWFKQNPQRARSNNSALLLRGTTTFEQFQTLVGWTREYGEPGFFWADSTEVIPNPCVEISFHPVDEETGLTGWQFCNLSLGNMGRVKTMEQARRAIRAAAIMGTLQAGYTTFGYLGEVSERITRRESLLGVSMTGMMEAPDLVFRAENLRELAQIVLDTNAEVAKLLGLPLAARATCVKPEGTSSCLLGTSSGIHPHHARRYLRRVQANRIEPPAAHFARVNPHAAESSVWNPNGTDIVLSFPIEAPKGAVISRELGAVGLLELVKLVKKHWVDAGKRPGHSVKEWLSHNVSNTVMVAEGEWDAVTRFIYDHREAYAGVSLLPRSGDLDYPQAPFVEVLAPEEIDERYGVHDDLGLLDTAGFRDLWEACDLALTTPPPVVMKVKHGDAECDVGIDYNVAPENGLASMESAVRASWMERFWCLAQKVGDAKKTAHMLKHKELWRQWERLTTETKPVDYTVALEEDDGGPEFEAMAACSGGACSII